MGKRSLKKTDKGFHSAINQGEGVSGRKKKHSLKSILKVQHLQSLATWASEKASIPSWGALLGRRFAACSEAFGIAHDPSIVSCQRCEMILQPGFNCTIRVVKNQDKTWRRPCKKKPKNTTPKNNVIYSCHFCSYENVKRGTPKGHMKDIYPSNPKIMSQPEPPRHQAHHAATMPLNDSCPVEPKLTPQPEAPPPEVHEDVRTYLKDSCPPDPEFTPQPEALGPKVHEDAATSLKDDMASKDDVKSEDDKPSIDTSKCAENPSAPVVRTGLTLLDKRRIRSKSKAKKLDESATTAEREQDGASSRKRRKKGWTSLKEIAESNEKERKKSFANLAVPFTL